MEKEKESLDQSTGDVDVVGDSASPQKPLKQYADLRLCTDFMLPRCEALG